MIDSQGFRHGIGIVLLNHERKLFWGRRANAYHIWQFPQGGIQPNEAPLTAMYRELYEEVGLKSHQVQLLSRISRWLYYAIPPRLRSTHKRPFCVGQKQKWFLLKLLCDEQQICFDRTQVIPEFDTWQWVDRAHVLDHVVGFKKDVYRQVLTTFADFL